MRRFRPRDSALALPLLLGACATEPRPLPPPTDECVLLCALERALTPSPEPAPPVVVPKPAPIPRPRAKPVVRHPIPARHHPRPVPRFKLRTETSVIPQATPKPASRAATVAPPSPPPAAVVQAPPPLARPPSSLSQSIPGSVGIMPPIWQP